MLHCAYRDGQAPGKHKIFHGKAKHLAGLHSYLATLLLIHPHKDLKNIKKNIISKLDIGHKNDKT